MRKGIQVSEDYPRGFDLGKYPENEGKLIALASSKTKKLANGEFDLSKRPGLTGPDPQGIFDPAKERLYSGMWGRAEINIYRPKHEKARHRISFGLQNFQKCKDGEPIGVNRSAPESVFGKFEQPEAEGNHEDLLASI